MTIGSEGWEQNRTRVGLVFLLLGVVLLLWAWGSWAYRTTTAGAAHGVQVPPAEVAKADQTRLLTSLPTLLMAGLLVFVAFLAGILAIRRGSRGLREAGIQRRSGPTPADDVWAAHLPPPLDDGAEDAEQD